MTSLENLEQEQNQGNILSTICIFEDGRKYVHFADENTTLYTLRKIIGAGSNLSYSAFKLYHEKELYDHNLDQESLATLFPEKKEIIFKVVVLPNVMSIENDLISVRVNIQEKCSKHIGKFLSFYCFTCRESICEECRASQHQGHVVKEKIDYLSSAEILINRYFKDIENIYKIDDRLRQQTAAAELMSTIKEQIFMTFRRKLDELENKCEAFIKNYMLKESVSTYNAKEAVEDLRKYSIESFIRLKNDINTNNIILNENIYLTLNNKLEQIDKYKQDTLSSNLTLFEKMNLIFSNVNALIQELVVDFDSVFNKWIGNAEFENISANIEKGVVPKVELQDLIDVVFKDLKVARLSLRQSEIYNGRSNKYQRMSISSKKSKYNPFENNGTIQEETDKILVEGSNSNVKPQTGSKIRPRSKQSKASKNSLDHPNETNNQDIRLLINRANEQVNQINTITPLRSTENHISASKNSKSRTSQISQNQSKKSSRNQAAASMVIETNAAINSQPQAQGKGNIFEVMNQKIQEFGTYSGNDLVYNSFGDNTLVCMFPKEGTNLVKVSTVESGVLTLQCYFTGQKGDYYGEAFNHGLSYCNYDHELYVSGGISFIGGKENKTFIKLTIDDKGNLNAVRLPDSNFCHSNHSMVGYNGYIYLIAGDNSNKTERFNVAENEWEVLPDLESSERVHPVLVLYNDFLYVFGGATHVKDEFVQEIERIPLTVSRPKWQTFAYKSDTDEGCGFSGAAYQPCQDDPSKVIFNGGKGEKGLMKSLRIFDFKAKKLSVLDLESENSYTFVESNLIKLENGVGNVYYHGFTDEGAPMNFGDINLSENIDE